MLGKVMELGVRSLALSLSLTTDLLSVLFEPLSPLL